MAQHKERLARAMTREMGKVLKEAGGDGRKDIRTYFDLIEFDEGRLK